MLSQDAWLIEEKTGEERPHSAIGNKAPMAPMKTFGQANGPRP
jgi:hypothetical protein